MSSEWLEILRLRDELLLHRERNVEIQDHILKLNEENRRKDEDIQKLTAMVSLCDPYGEERRRVKLLEESEKECKIENKRLLEEVKWFENEFEYATNVTDKYLTEEDRRTRLKLDQRIEVAIQTQVNKAERKHERCQFNLENMQKQFEFVSKELSLAKKESEEKDVQIDEMRQTIDHLNSALAEKQDRDTFDLGVVKCERISPDFRMADFQATVSYLNRKITKLKDKKKVQEDDFRHRPQKAKSFKRMKSERDQST